jgi:hypothetical protein
MRDFLTAVSLVEATQLFAHYSHESEFFVGLASTLFGRANAIVEASL